MTFRIDAIALDGANPERWTCSFKGFRGQGGYGRARLDDSRSQLLLESTLDNSENLAVPVNAPPPFMNRTELHSWIAKHLEALGWGPEVDHERRVMKSR